MYFDIPGTAGPHRAALVLARVLLFGAVVLGLMDPDPLFGQGPVGAVSAGKWHVRIVVVLLVLIHQHPADDDWTGLTLDQVIPALGGGGSLGLFSQQFVAVGQFVILFSDGLGHVFSGLLSLGLFQQLSHGLDLLVLLP